MIKHLYLLLAIALFAINSPVTAENSHKQIRLAEQYSKSFTPTMISSLPFSDDVSFYGPLLAEPIHGKANVLALLNRVVLSIKSVNITSMNVRNDGACLEMTFVFESKPEVGLDEVHCLSFDENEIKTIRLYFDPREFLKEQ